MPLCTSLHCFLSVKKLPFPAFLYPDLIAPKDSDFIPLKPMITRRFSQSLVAALVVAPSLQVWAEDKAPLPPEHVEFFETNIRPLLSEYCLECHSQEKGKVKGGLNMDTRGDFLKGGENGVSLKPGDVSGSSVVKAVEWVDDLQMPPKKKMPDDKIELFKKWVAMGAPDPRDGSTAKQYGKKDHWAFQPVTRPNKPEVKNQSWCKNSIDHFILAKLEEKGMLPSDPPETGTPEQQRTKKEALLRRAYFDLIGIPPSPQQIRAFTNDPAPDAFAKVIDQLLDSPMYGERWARHWLDTARYSDTTGSLSEIQDQDFRYAYAWAYRDWVIRAINKDMPYDQFVLNQLAADFVPNNDPANLAALGFLTVGQRFQSEDDIINDRIDVVSRGFLGLTVACARCHDHKFDPIKTADYYALRGVFKSIREPKEGPVIAGDPNSKEYQEFERKLEELEKNAYATYFQMQREYAAEFRMHPGAYFEGAFYLRQRGEPEAQKKADEITKKYNLTPGIGGLLNSSVVRHSTRRDPIFGPFLSLIGDKQDREFALKRLLERDPAETGFNPEVIEFLRNAGKDLPSDVATVAALFEKFYNEKVVPLLGDAPNPKGNPVTEIEGNSGIFKKIADPSTDVSDSKERALMELAVFPKKLVLGSEMSVLTIQNQISEWGVLGGGPQLERRSGVSKINELKLTSRGGPVRAMVVEDLPKPVESPIFPRGNPPKEKDVATVPRRFLEVLSGDAEPEPFQMGSGRYEMAKAIASKSNPLTARVIVNRIWMYHFGEGLVRTPDDLGNQSGKPSHQELLDWLTSWFMDDYGPAKPGWSMKALHKAIMLSSAYQQSSRSLFMKEHEKLDAANNLLWRANVRRLDFEAFRDALLTMGGKMDATMYGPPINLVSEPYSYRRSIYGYIDRSNVPDLLMQFDVSSPLEPNTKRTSTIVPQQALFLMNSPFTVSLAKQVVQRREVIQAVAVEKNPTAGILAIFQIVLGRTPSGDEFRMAMEFLQKEQKSQPAVAAAMAPVAATAMKRAQAELTRERNRVDAKKSISNDGDLVQRTVLTPWETLVQALMFCNEAAYLN